MTGSAVGLGRLLLLALVAGVVLVPLLAVAVGGLKTMGELRTDPFGLPAAWAWDTYGRILAGERLWRALAALPARQRAVLVLRYYEGLTDAEIADVLDCAPGTVRSSASRALRTLRLDEQIRATP